MNYENATHLLHCAHALGTHRLEYTMRCHVLKDMGDGRRKVLVFGDMYWKGRETRNRVRYVMAQRLTKRSPDSSKAGDSSLPEIVKVENVLPAESG